MAARVAAVRETIEEAGIAVGLDPLPDPDALGRLRSGLNAHGSFADLLPNEGLALDPAALIPFARWCPRLAHVRIRSEERRVGEEGGSAGRSRWSPYH